MSRRRAAGGRGPAGRGDHHLARDALRLAAGELGRGLTTSYGYTLRLELAGEPILLELPPDVERSTDRAARLEQWLLTQGWTPTNVEGV